MHLQKANRSKAKMKLALQGPSGSGKSLGALLIAYGLCGDWSKIAVIDTENHSANLYADLGSYHTLNLAAPFTPEKYIEALKLCEESNIEVIIIDSISHEWDGSGGILEVHSGMVGNSFTNWGKLTQRHNAFVQAILQSNSHVIGTVRSKQDYVLNEKNGRMVPEKVGLKAIQRDGLDYEFTIVLDIDCKHNASASKDRTSLFINSPEFPISIKTGKLIRDWCNKGSDITTEIISDKITVVMSDTDLEKRINECKSVGELLTLYHQSPLFQESHHGHFSSKRKELSSPINTPPNLNNFKTISNGTHTIEQK